eukprot:8514202-Pyramimonas_sp.AAC.2
MEPHNRDALKEEASSTARRARQLLLCPSPTMHTGEWDSRDANEATAGDLNGTQEMRMRQQPGI